MRPSNITMARETAKRISRKLSVDVTISYAYGQPRAYTHDEGRELSPRCSPKELYSWLSAYEKGADDMQEHCARLEATRLGNLLDTIMERLESEALLSSPGSIVSQAFDEATKAAEFPESYPETIARLLRELANARERANSLARELERARNSEAD